MSVFTTLWLMKNLHEREAELEERRKMLENSMRDKHLYPMGVLTFAIACTLCKNRGTEKCVPCKGERVSGFEIDGNVKPVRIAKVKKIKQRGRE